MNKYAKFFYIFMLSFVLGCGYTTGTLLPSHLRTIYVDSFQNKIDVSQESSDRRAYEIYRTGLESDVTKAIIDNFIFDGNLSIVGADEADLVLRGELINYTKEPLKYDKFDNVEEYRVRVSVNIELEDVGAGKTLWRESGFTGESTFRTSGALAKSEDAAADDAVRDLARRIVEKATEGW